ncbi:hypothetical protein AB2L27_12305 [Kineococcus sp. LSe6-4]|uniref:Secreted protein n=1 Tax=Kineococcus halophytocola TaxID=3234027 RepID=A0ABV4H1U4_9ACTN
MVPVLVAVALAAFAGTVLLHQPPPTTAPGTVTGARPGEVCLHVQGPGAGHDVCLDRQHVEHLALAGTHPGDCVEVTWTSDLVVAGSLVRVVRC